MGWNNDQKWESNWHGDCINSYWEETKQQVYAKRMGLLAEMVGGKYPVYDLKGITVLDIGAGPYSMLLKCINFTGYAVDPCDYPEWVYERYRAKRIIFAKYKGEDLENHPKVDEVWIYNCLQHTIDPEKILQNAKKCTKLIRLFEWIDTGTSIGHPHNLTENDLNQWLGGIGKVEEMNESGCYGKAFYGIFKGDRYA